MFKNVPSSMSETQEMIFLRLSWWIKAWETNFPFSSEEIRRNPLCLKWNPTPKINLTTPKPSQNWFAPPPHSTLKWNVDASFNPLLSRAAIGGVLRNESGNFVCIFSCPIPPMEINNAEVLAIHIAIQISLNNTTFKSHALEIESDSRNAVLWCNNNKGGPWNLSFILDFIRSASRRGLNVQIHYRRRNSNAVAGALAKQGLNKNSDFVASF